MQILRLLMDEPNVLFLDEPTNDLDIETLTQLEDLLDGWPGTLLGRPGLPSTPCLAGASSLPKEPAERGPAPPALLPVPTRPSWTTPVAPASRP